MFKALVTSKKVSYKSLFKQTRLFYSSNQTDDPKEIINYIQLRAHELEKVNHSLKEKVFWLIGYVTTMSIELSVTQVKRSEEILAAQKEIIKKSNEVTETQREIIKRSDEYQREIIKRSDEYQREITNAHRQIASLQLRLKELENDLKDSNNSYLIAKSYYNVRGALEYCRAYLASKKKITYHFNEPFDETLKRLEEDKDFLREIEQRCHDLKVDIKTVKKCLGGLYHTACKHLHGHNYGTIIIKAECFPAEGDRIALGAIFRLCHISYNFMDEKGNVIYPCPY